MTPEERDELRRGLEGAGFPALARLTTFYGTNPNAECAELRSLLRRDVPRQVWVVQLHDRSTGGCLRAVFSRHSYALDWTNRCMKNSGVVFTQHTIDAEVPDGES